MPLRHYIIDGCLPVSLLIGAMLDASDTMSQFLILQFNLVPLPDWNNLFGGVLVEITSPGVEGDTVETQIHPYISIGV